MENVTYVLFVIASGVILGVALAVFFSFFKRPPVRRIVSFPFALKVRAKNGDRITIEAMADFWTTLRHNDEFAYDFRRFTNWWSSHAFAAANRFGRLHLEASEMMNPECWAALESQLGLIPLYGSYEAARMTVLDMTVTYSFWKAVWDAICAVGNAIRQIMPAVRDFMAEYYPSIRDFMIDFLPLVKACMLGCVEIYVAMFGNGATPIPEIEGLKHDRKVAEAVGNWKAANTDAPESVKRKADSIVIDLMADD